MLSTVICVSFEWLALQVTNENGLCDLRACLPTNFTAGVEDLTKQREAEAQRAKTKDTLKRKQEDGRKVTPELEESGSVSAKKSRVEENKQDNSNVALKLESYVKLQQIQAISSQQAKQKLLDADLAAAALRVKHAAEFYKFMELS
jgi:hypothetical protein